MGKDSVIFIEESRGDYERLGGSGRDKWGSLMLVSPLELPQRIVTAFVPPLFGSRKVYVDLAGPLLAVALLATTLHLGHATKDLPASPSSALLIYLLTTACAVVLGARVSSSRLSPVQVLALLGYSLYGPLLTLLFSIVLPNSLFFPILFVFGGATAFRVAIVLLLTIPKPVVRLLLCSLVSISHLLFTIFAHFAYMHTTFVYGRRS